MSAGNAKHHPGDVTFDELSAEQKQAIARGWGLDPVADIAAARTYFDQRPPQNRWQIVTASSQTDGSYEQQVQRTAANAGPEETEAFVAMNSTVRPAKSNVVSLHARETMPDLAGDHLNARRFLDEHGTDVRYSPELGRWFIWNESWWQEDRLEQIKVKAAETIDNLRPWTLEATGDTDYKRRARHYEQSTRAGRRDSLLSIAGVESDVVVGINDLDAHPYLLACKNGTVDLRTSELMPANREHLITCGVPIDFDPDASSKEWEAFIDEIFLNDRELAAYVQRLLGYCLTGAVREHVMPVFYGAGSNGKSTLVGVVQDLLGDKITMTAPEGLVVNHHHEPHPERFAALRGKRMVVSNELEAKAVLAEQTVKMLTGGDTLSARELYGRRFDFAPSHKVILLTNHRPRVRGTDHAIWRRLRLVPFDYTVPPESQDGDLRRRFVEEQGRAILTWLVYGAVLWHDIGLLSAAAVDNATTAYRESQNTLAAFLGECTVETAGARTKVGDLYDRWRSWCDTVGEKTVGRKQDFVVALEETSLKVISRDKTRWVVDLGIRTETEVSSCLTP